MKIIETLVDRIDDELSGAEEYARLAHSYRPEHPRIADKFLELAETEMSHAKLLHAEAEKVIGEVRQRDGDPPAAMLAVYEYEHGKQIRRAAMIRQLIAEYRNG